MYRCKNINRNFVNQYRHRDPDLQRFYKGLGRKYIEKLDPEKSIHFDKPLSRRGVRFADENPFSNIYDEDKIFYFEKCLFFYKEHDFFYAKRVVQFVIMFLKHKEF